MGTGKIFICDKCGHEVHASWGAGFLFPQVYIDTIRQIKEGKHGPLIKSFIEEHPDGAVNAETTLARCDECGHYENVQDLTMYIPQNGYKRVVDPERIWSTSAYFKGADYIARYELEDHYIEYKKYPHKCKCCNGNMSIIPLTSYSADSTGRDVDEIDSEIKEIECPVCGEKMIVMSFINWD